jgi:signal transduction histidine kinase
VVLNLVKNAIDATASLPGGERTIAIRAKPARGGIEIQVGDTGPGIDPAQIEKVFEPFFTTKRNGLGLGLAISRSIIEAHRGRIRVESAPSAGTVFHVFLPHAAQGHAIRRTSAT